MEANPLLFRDLTYIFLAAVGGGLLAWRLRLPLILGFVVGGIVISPFTPGLHLSDLHTFESFAEVGVVLLMFSIGVEFSISELMSVKWVALVGGTCGIAMSIMLAVGAAKLIGWPVMQGVVVGAIVSVASTMVLARLPVDRKALGTSYGRVMIGITLFEDLAVVLITVVLPSFAGSGEGHFVTAAWTIGKALILLIPLTFLTMKVIPPLLRKARDTKDPELFLLVAIAVCVGASQTRRLLQRGRSSPVAAGPVRRSIRAHQHGPDYQNVISPSSSRYACNRSMGQYLIWSDTGH